MPRRTPKYAFHKPSGQARVRIEGKSHYLGVYDSPESHERYEKLVARWLGGTLNADRESLSIARLGILYIDHCRIYYVKNGKQTSEVLATQAALKPLIRLFGREKVSNFGPKKLKLVREDIISTEAARSTNNSHAQRIVRMLKWGVENELVDACPYEAEAVRNKVKRASRKSPMIPSQAARTAKENPRWLPSKCYRRDCYSRAISRACKLAKVAEWAPNRLRHNAATELRKLFPIEAVRTVLGHSTAFTTEIYAELDFETARQVVEKAG